jgi:hypothetical protein
MQLLQAAHPANVVAIVTRACIPQIISRHFGRGAKSTMNRVTILTAVFLAAIVSVSASARLACGESPNAGADSGKPTSHPDYAKLYQFVLQGQKQPAAPAGHRGTTAHRVACPLTGPGGQYHAERVAIERELGKATPSDAAPNVPHVLPDIEAAAAEPKSATVKQAADLAAKSVSYSKLTAAEQQAVDQAHAEVYDCDPYPSASKCAACHPGHYREWSVSPHAYAQLSPVFNAMSGKLNKLLNGTLGDFCIRCHTPVGMALNEPMIMSNMDRHPAAREGVTCSVCHRINKAWGKGSGRQDLIAADIHGPVYGPTGNAILAEVLADREKYGVTNPDSQSDERGRDIHSVAVPFFQLQTSGFCGTCHDVFAPNGFRLEDAFSEYKTSVAALKKNQSCQDCHMGEVPGEPAGYRIEPAAKVGNVWTPPRKRTNHMIAGPDYSVVHPGIFPHNPEAVKEEHDAYAHAGGGLPGLATMREWLEFDYKAGWGTPEFERSDAAGEINKNGPEAWRDPARRYRARDILKDQFKLLAEYTEARRRVLATAFRLSDIESDVGLGKGLGFRVLVYNGTDGHGVPTGFDAERVVFLRVLVWDANGKIVYVSGDLDPNGDIRDSHSVYVHNGKLPIDQHLFSLQTRFLTRNIRGGEREQVLAAAYSLDPLPYIRPETRPFTVLGRPLGARKHKQNLEANNGKRWARYHVHPSNLTGCGPYTASVQVVAGMVPINLVHEIEDVGFDYDLSAREVAERIVAGHLVLHERRAVLEH